MNAHEARGVQHGFQAGDGLLFQITLAPAVERDVVILRLDIIQLFDRNYMHARAVLHHDPLRMLARRPRLRHNICGQTATLADSEFGALQGALEAFRAEGLKKIVHGVGVEGAHGVLIVGSDEDDRRARVDQLQNLEAIELRHLNVQEHDVR